MKLSVYKSGFPFSDTIKMNIDSQIKRVRENKASLLTIDGLLGEGKTTFGVEAAEYIEGRPIDFDTQIALGGVEFARKIELCIQQRKKVIIYDESGDFTGRGAMTKFNRRLNRIFDTFRTFKIIIILILPSFTVLDQQIMIKGVVRVLFHVCERRGNTGNISVYSRWGMAWLRRSTQPGRRNPGGMVMYSWTSPNARGHFLNLEPKRARLLKAFSDGGKKDVMQEVNIGSAGLMSYDDIAREVGITTRQVKKIFSKQKVKYERTYKRKRYFSPAVIGRFKRSGKK